MKRIKYSRLVLVLLLVCSVSFFTILSKDMVGKFTLFVEQGVKKNPQEEDCKGGVEFIEQYTIGEVKYLNASGIKVRIEAADKDMLWISGDSSCVSRARFTYDANRHALTLAYDREDDLQERAASSVVATVYVKDLNLLRELTLNRAMLTAEGLVEGKSFVLKVEDQSSVNMNMRVDELELEAQMRSVVKLSLQEATMLSVISRASELTISGDVQAVKASISNGGAFHGSKLRSPMLDVFALDASATVFITDKATLHAGGGASIFCSGKYDDVKLSIDGGEIIYQ